MIGRRLWHLAIATHSKGLGGYGIPAIATHPQGLGGYGILP
ncbi:hypothetical protein [Leyella stercorea]|nr:hypothetical protein [Leyella stercorea]